MAVLSGHHTLGKEHWPRKDHSGGKHRGRIKGEKQMDTGGHGVQRGDSVNTEVDSQPRVAYRRKTFLLTMKKDCAPSCPKT